MSRKLNLSLLKFDLFPCFPRVEVIYSFNISPGLKRLY